MLTRIRLTLLLTLTAALLSAAQRTALDRYVQKPDPNYKYELVRTLPGRGYTAYVLDMTSQSWRTEADVDRTLWKHWVTIIKPDKPSGTTGLLFIAGGSNGSKPPERPDAILLDAALATNTVVAELRQIPNQPLVFRADGQPRREDDLIVYTWNKYLETGDETWPARLPMTKAAVRAMDTVTAFCASGGVKVDRFVVAGGSKRGWTTWTTAAADKRVVAIVPAAIDCLNLEKSFEHHWRAYGFWAPAVRDYSDGRIFERMRLPRMKALMKIEEPYSYRGRLTIPKLVLNSAGDQYFLPDSWRFYYHDLKGEKYLRYVPNTDHGLRALDVPQTLIAFYDAIVNNRPRPRLNWNVSKDGTIRVSSIDKPVEVKLWRATNAGKRDFRLMSIGPAYKSTVLNDQGSGEHVYVAKVPAPEKGWSAAFIELTYSTGGKYPLKVSTGVTVVPDTLPFPPPTETSRVGRE